MNIAHKKSLKQLLELAELHVYSRQYLRILNHRIMSFKSKSSY